METLEASGYRVEISGSFGSNPVLRRTVAIVPSNLEEGLTAIGEDIRTWIERQGFDPPADGQLRQLHVIVLGPSQDLIQSVDVPDSESDEKSEAFRLINLAYEHLAEEDHAKAQAAIEELSTVSKRLRTRDFVHPEKILRGKLALAMGNGASAAKFLVASVPTAPRFGLPDMELAQDLLDGGERKSVLRYLEQCLSFAEDDEEQREDLENHLFLLRAGRNPRLSG